MPEPIDDAPRWDMTTVRDSLIAVTPGEEVQAGPLSVRVSDLPLFRRGGDGCLQQAIRLRVRSDADAGPVSFRAMQGESLLDEQTATIAAGAQSLHLFVPEVDASTRVDVRISSDAFETALAQVEVQPQRKWTVNLIHHSHFDHGYTDPQALVMEQQLAYLDAALRIADATDAFPDDAKFRWNVEANYPLRHWLAARPRAMRDELVRRVKEGRIEVSALPYTMHTEAYSIDELARQLWFADELREQYDIPIVSAMQTDVPGATVGLLNLLVDAGVRYLSVAHNFSGRSVPYLVGGQALTRPFWWQAANGKRLLVWHTDTRKGEAYMEGVLTGLAESIGAATATLPEYLKALAHRANPYGNQPFNYIPPGEDLDVPPYPHDILHLRIQACIADNAPPSPLIPEIVKQWNEQWAFPKLRMATNRDFFVLAEERLGERIDTFSGDWTDWWADGIGSAARALGRNRIAQGEIRTAQTLHALADHRDGDANPATAAAIERVYDDLALFDEHTWGAGNPWGNSLEKFRAGELQREKKLGYAHDAYDGARALLNGGAARLAHAVAASSDALASIVVFNPSAFARTDLVRAFVPEDVIASGQGFAVVDADSGAPVRHAVEPQQHPGFRADGWWLCFAARDVPPVGYARFEVVAAAPAAAPTPSSDGNVIENDHYRVAVDPMSGALVELLDKGTGRSLIDANAAMGFNQYVYDRYGTAPGFNHLSSRMQDQNLVLLGDRSLAAYGAITARSSTPIADSITVRLAGDGCEWVETTYSLPRDVKRLDVANRIMKVATPTKESVYFAFPFAVADPAPLIEITGGIASEDVPRIPGSADHMRAVRHWIALRDEGATVAWATREAPLVKLGNISLPYAPFPQTVLRGSRGPSVIYSWALNNIWDTNFPAQQGGEMTFRYSIASAGPGDPVALAQRTAAGLSAPLVGVCCPAAATSSEQPPRAGYCAVEPGSVELTHIARSRRGDGLVVHLHSIAAETVEARVDFGDLPVTRARVGDFLERNQRDAALEGRVTRFEVEPGAYATVAVELRGSPPMPSTQPNLPAIAGTDAVAPPWWRGAVVYENHLPSFKDGNGDGIGDLEGLIQGLDYLGGTLGVDAIWIGPCWRSPLLDQGFDVSDFKDVEPTFGDLATFDRLIEEAHKRGIKILVDYIPNHTSDQHPWFVASRSSREHPKRDWYIWADPASDGGPPNNWTTEIGGSVWELDAATGQYYLHTHLREQPDLNWRNPEVRAAMLDVLRFYLQRGADGVRIDVAHLLMKDPQLRDNPPAPPGHHNPFELRHPDFYVQLHVNDRCHPDVHETLAEIRAVLDEFDAVAIGEIDAMEWDAWAQYYGEGLRGVQLPFAFKLIDTTWNAGALREAIRNLEAHLPDGAWPVLALGNHDRSRLATRIGRAQARLAGMLLLTWRGTPVLLYGDELGLVDQDVARERQRDTFGLLLEGGVSRDPARTPLPWNGGVNSGFSTAAERDLWLPICTEYETINVEAQLAEPGSMLSLYRALIALRKQSAALRLGTYAEHPAGDEHVLAFVRQLGAERKLVVLNLSGEPRTVELDESGEIVLASGLDRHGERVEGTLELRPAEGVVIATDG